MRRTDRGRGIQGLANRKVLIEGILRRNITDVALQFVEILIERLPIEENVPSTRLQLPRDHFHERAFAGSARAHYANELAPRDGEGNSFQPDVATAEAVRHFAQLERPNDVALLFDDALGKIAAQ